MEARKQEARQYMTKLKADVSKKLHEPGAITNVLDKFESKTGVDRLYVVGGLAAIVALYLIFGHFAELVCNCVGFLYPAYVSIKAIESATKDDDTQWLTYWVVFGLFNVFEFASDEIVGWFPLYWLAKCAFMLWLHLPVTRGAHMLYHKAVRPFVLKHQATIDGTVRDAAQSARDAYEEHKTD